VADEQTLPEEPAGPSRRRERKKSRGKAEEPGVSINSLMDIIFIVLVYLIGTFASSAIEVNDPSVTLPHSTSDQNIEFAPVVMVTGRARLSVDPNNPKQSKWVENDPWILVDDKRVVQLDRESYRVPEGEKDPATGNYVIKPLREVLAGVRELQAASAEVSESEGFTGRVIILADKETPYRVLTEILITCGEAGFGEFRFAIIKKQ
jgi:biopolymer transport protein ExbD